VNLPSIGVGQGLEIAHFVAVALDGSPGVGVFFDPVQGVVWPVMAPLLSATVSRLSFGRQWRSKLVQVVATVLGAVPDGEIVIS